MIRQFPAELSYLSPTSRINRRYVAPGAEVSTGTYETHRVLVSDARSAPHPFTLSANGFVLAHHISAVRDFRDKTEVEARYPSEVQQLVQELTGADFVLPLGGMLRSVEGTGPGVQPPAADVHVDMTEPSAHRRARLLLERAGRGDLKYRRFIASSLWRPFSEPPHDWPLAVCDGSSVTDDEGVPNLMLVVDAIPDTEAMSDELADTSSLPAAYVFHFNPNHRWWFFPDMTRDEVILLKLYDSDHSGAWRVPHTAFHHTTQTGARPRESIEFRTIAYFT
jgi:hypothetical protein